MSDQVFEVIKTDLSLQQGGVSLQKCVEVKSRIHYSMPDISGYFLGYFWVAPHLGVVRSLDHLDEGLINYPDDLKTFKELVREHPSWYSDTENWMLTAIRYYPDAITPENIQRITQEIQAEELEKFKKENKGKRVKINGESVQL